MCKIITANVVIFYSYNHYVSVAYVRPSFNAFTVDVNWCKPVSTLLRNNFSDGS